MRSGANMEIVAKSMLDDPANDVVYFFHDEAQNSVAATVQRNQVAGLIFHAQKSSAIPSHH
jgi:imidazoleglycerol phosphate synthase glutamine amidotransferase subunit HisH